MQFDVLRFLHESFIPIRIRNGERTETSKKPGDIKHEAIGCLAILQLAAVRPTRT